jgi:hypothetical protein
MLMLKIFFFYVLSIPVCNVLLDRIINLEYLITEKKVKKLKSIFYLPFVNIITYFIYLLVVIVKFKRPL